MLPDNSQSLKKLLPYSYFSFHHQPVSPRTTISKGSLSTVLTATSKPPSSRSIISSISSSSIIRSSSELRRGCMRARRKARSVLEWKVVITHRFCSIAARASWWESSPVKRRSTFWITWVYNLFWLVVGSRWRKGGKVRTRLPSVESPEPAQIPIDDMGILRFSPIGTDWGTAIERPDRSPRDWVMREMRMPSGTGCWNRTMRP